MGNIHTYLQYWKSDSNKKKNSLYNYKQYTQQSRENIDF